MHCNLLQTLIILGILIGNKVNPKQNSHAKSNVCTSPDCVESAKMLLHNMNALVDPCENFYEFACGNFVKNTRIPDDKSTVNIPHLIGDQLEANIRNMIEDREPMVGRELRTFQLAKSFYKTCMNTEAIEENSLNTLRRYLRNFGGWPVLDGKRWNENSFDWQEVVFKLHETGFGSSYFLRLYTFFDPKNSTRTVLFIHQAMLGLKREYLSRGLYDKLVTAYYHYMVDVAIILGANEKSVWSELFDSLQFEIQLANFSLPQEELRNFTALYNPFTIKELEKKYPDISWMNYINQLLNGVSVGQDEVIILQAPDYVEQLLNLLKITPKRVQANYLLWRVVENSVSFLNQKIRKRLLFYTKTVSGTTALPPRWRECISVVNSGLPIAISALYVRRYFSSASKLEAETMVRSIRKQLHRILDRISWMDHRTLNRAIDKLNAMEAYVGYPDELLQDGLLEQYYGNLNILEGRYLESVLEITKFERFYEFQSLHSFVNKSNWIEHGNVAVVNAFYTFSENSINLPAGILQGVFFSGDRPKYMNYGAIGTVIGHEMIHGYDDKGRQYDKDGNLVDWWEDQTNQNFISRAQCFIDQYSNYRDKQVGLNLNGVNAQGENIADNGGVKAAYQAYQSWLHTTRIQEPLLPGFEHFTTNQLFWLSMANAFCTKSRPEYTQLIITTDEHSPAMYRVLGTVSNMRHFATDFKCDQNSAMNPMRKCTLW